MDPVSLAIVSTVLTAAGTGAAAYGQSQSMKAQAASEQQRADIEAKWSERRALEERSAAQRGASEEMRKGRLAQSRLTALAGGSGSGSDDATVMDLWGDIEKEGRYNASAVTAAGEQRAAGMKYQADLGVWGADANAKIKKAAARTTLISGLLNAGGQMAGGMAGRYGAPPKAAGTGYGAYG
jgi:hypothetical protein